MKTILIIGSTGKLGTKLVNFCYNNNIKIKTITCFNNIRKVRRQQNKLKCLYFNLSNDDSKKILFKIFQIIIMIWFIF